MKAEAGPTLKYELPCPRRDFKEARLEFRVMAPYEHWLNSEVVKDSNGPFILDVVMHYDEWQVLINDLRYLLLAESFENADLKGKLLSWSLISPAGYEDSLSENIPAGWIAEQEKLTLICNNNPVDLDAMRFWLMEEGK